MTWLAVGIGAALGAWLRWGLSVFLNQAHSHLPLGTVSANLIGGYLIGIALAFFDQATVTNPAWRLFIVTGFLGGLTTFSTFSGESMFLLQRAQYGWAFLHILTHLLGSILLCIAGFATFRFISSLTS